MIIFSLEEDRRNSFKEWGLVTSLYTRQDGIYYINSPSNSISFHFPDKGKVYCETLNLHKVSVKKQTNKNYIYMNKS